MRARPAGPAAPLILLVDDAEDLRTVLTGVLEAAGFRVVTAASGQEALRSVFAERPDLVVLDLGLPDLDGLEVLTRIRDMTDLPVLVLTARSVDWDKLKGFQLGADDYVTKPFSVSELMARVAALLRRVGGTARADAAPFAFGPWRVDPTALTASRSEETAALSRREVEMLALFARERGRIISRRTLLVEVWGMTHVDRIETRTVDMHIAKLRKKLGEDGRRGIETVRGEGYRLS